MLAPQETTLQNADACSDMSICDFFFVLEDMGMI
jgi:hypothetical protein